MQISFVMLIFLLFSDGAKVSKGGKLLEGDAPLWKKAGTWDMQIDYLSEVKSQESIGILKHVEDWIPFIT